MWAPFIEDLKTLRERAEIERELAENYNMTVSIEISANTYLKLSESLDSISRDPEFCFANKAAVERCVDDVLCQEIKDHEKGLKRSKLKWKTRRFG